jgi:hypothetical protein
MSDQQPSALEESEIPIFRLIFTEDDVPLPAEQDRLARAEIMTLNAETPADGSIDPLSPQYDLNRPEAKPGPDDVAFPGHDASGGKARLAARDRGCARHTEGRQANGVKPALVIAVREDSADTCGSKRCNRLAEPWVGRDKVRGAIVPLTECVDGCRQTDD